MQQYRRKTRIPWRKTGGKQEENRRKTGGKLEENRRKTGEKQEGNRRKTGGKQEKEKVQQIMLLKNFCHSINVVKDIYRSGGNKKKTLKSSRTFNIKIFYSVHR